MLISIKTLYNFNQNKVLAFYKYYPMLFSFTHQVFIKYHCGPAIVSALKTDQWTKGTNNFCLHEDYTLVRNANINNIARKLIVCLIMMSLRGQKQERRCMRGQGSPLWKKSFWSKIQTKEEGSHGNIWQKNEGHTFITLCFIKIFS